MTRKLAALLTATAAAVALASTGASAATMHSKLGARLSGMGEHGVANLTATTSTGKLCWKFDVPTLKGATRATIHTGKNGKVLVVLGMHYTKSGCAKTSAMALEHLETKPTAYSLWIDTKGHPGDLRGMLFAGTAHM